MSVMKVGPWGPKLPATMARCGAVRRSLSTQPGAHVRHLRHLIIAGLTVPTFVAAQGTGTLRGTVTDVGGRVVPGALVRVVGTRLGALVDSAGTYRVADIPAGAQVVRIAKLGYAPDSSTVQIIAEQVASHSVQLRPSAALCIGQPDKIDDGTTVALGKDAHGCLVGRADDTHLRVAEHLLRRIRQQRGQVWDSLLDVGAIGAHKARYRHVRIVDAKVEAFAQQPLAEFHQWALPEIIRLLLE